MYFIENLYFFILPFTTGETGIEEYEAQNDFGKPKDPGYSQFLMQHIHSDESHDGAHNADTYRCNGSYIQIITAPWGTTLRSDIGPNYRRGYADASMNTTELIWKG